MGPTRVDRLNRTFASSVPLTSTLCSLAIVLRRLEYAADGWLVDDTGHSWRRVSDWVERADAERLIHEATRFAVQGCSAPPITVRPERFKRDVKARMITATAAEDYNGKSAVSTVMIGELWRSSESGDLLLFVEQGPQACGDPIVEVEPEPPFGQGRGRVGVSVWSCSVSWKG